MGIPNGFVRRCFKNARHCSTSTLLGMAPPPPCSPHARDLRRLLRLERTGNAHTPHIATPYKPSSRQHGCLTLFAVNCDPFDQDTNEPLPALFIVVCGELLSVCSRHGRQITRYLRCLPRLHLGSTENAQTPHAPPVRNKVRAYVSCIWQGFAPTRLQSRADTQGRGGVGVGVTN